MKLSINPDTTVGALLEAYPEAESVLIELAPAFARLRNPVVRRTVAKIATLEQAAKIGGISLHTMIQKLRELTGQTGADVPADSSTVDVGGIPAWVASSRIAEE